MRCQCSTMEEETDHTMDETVMSEVMDMYPPTWFVEYGVLKNEVVPYCGPNESYMNLSRLYADDQAFFRDLVADETLRKCFEKGGTTQPESKHFKTIEAALINRCTFARLQLTRIIRCELGFDIMDEKEKKHVAHDSYRELCQSMELLENWGTNTALELHEELDDDYQEAREFLKRVGEVLEEDE